MKKNLTVLILNLIFWCVFCWCLYGAEDYGGYVFIGYTLASCLIFFFSFAIALIPVNLGRNSGNERLNKYALAIHLLASVAFIFIVCRNLAIDSREIEERAANDNCVEHNRSILATLEAGGDDTQIDAAVSLLADAIRKDRAGTKDTDFCLEGITRKKYDTIIQGSHFSESIFFSVYFGHDRGKWFAYKCFCNGNTCIEDKTHNTREAIEERRKMDSTVRSFLQQ